MSKLPQTLASRVVPDGKLRSIPGLTTGAYSLDQPFFLVFSPTIDGDTDASNLGPHYFPFAAKIVAGYILYLEDVDATVHYYVGTLADEDHFVDHTATTDDDTGEVESLTLLGDATIAAGETLVFGTDGGTTSLGNAVITLICVPA